MLNEPISDAKTETMLNKSQLAPQPGRELHPHAFGATGVYALNGAGSAASVRSPGAQRHQIFAGMQATHGNQAVLRIMQNSPQMAGMSALRPSQGVILQRKCACGGSSESEGECAECKEKREAPLQRRPAPADASSTVGAIPPIVHSVLNSPGQPLDAGTRAFMEPRFGHDFSHVRVHTDPRAAESARAVNALAYTVGRDMVFGAGQYAPGTNEGRRLMAHELTHVVQQDGTSGRNMLQEKLVIGHQDDAYEHEAEEQATRVIAESNVNPLRSYMPAKIGILHRQAEEGPAPTPQPAAPIMTQGGCPRYPTNIGNQSPNPDCGPRSDTVLGELFRFCTDSDQMRNEEQPHLLALLLILQGMETIEVHGYASPEGPRGREVEYNLSLSCLRANSVVAMLVSNGIPANKIITFKHGGTSALGSVENNRSVVIPLSPRRITPVPTNIRFRVAALSFLACAGCNPFTDDTAAVALIPPATEPPTTGTGYRMKHWMEAEVRTVDGIHIDPGSPGIVSSGFSAGESGYCGTSSRAASISAASPGSPVGISSGLIEGWEWDSMFETRVGATVPATLPGAPCGPLGWNTAIPTIRNRFRMRVFADGRKESEFVSVNFYPFHYLYEDGSLKLFRGSPVHPTVDFTAWATSTGVPLGLAEVGFKALRYACCNPSLISVECPTSCISGVSVLAGAPRATLPPTTETGLAGCGELAVRLTLGSCPTACVPAGTICTPVSWSSNP